MLVILGPKQGPLQKDPDFHKDVKRHRVWSISQVKEVHVTRYLLRYSAVEVFFADAIPPAFFNFSSPKQAKSVGAKLYALALAAGKRGGGGGHGGELRRRDPAVLVDRRKAGDLAERARELWRRREMSNFEYLMRLNTLAGRSFNDLMQYPVFPWVLADYTSERLDMAAAGTFRDLSRPVGALDEKRFQTFMERFENFSDPDIPSFLYGSHYSTAGIVLFFLMRMEPFTTLSLNLQGGKFDHADRLFHSVETAFRNCLTHTSDVKELVPEFFCQPEFLLNSNGYYLGVKQEGGHIGDVVLPPWAKGSPEEFVRLNREALESEYVSEHLHEWVDLIFGHKQRGSSAVEAGNVFYYLTYEGAIDLDRLEDPVERASVEDQIANFGQTPCQLFRKPHPRRGSPVPVTRPLYYAPASITLTSKLPPSAAPLPAYAAARAGSDPAAVVFVGVHEGRAIALTKAQMLAVRSWITPYSQTASSFTFAQSQDPFFGFGETAFTRKVGSPFSRSADVHQGCFSTLPAAASPLLLTCGHWDNCFQCFSLADGRLLRTIRQHNDVVTCIAVSSDGSTVVTGSRDTTLMVWKTQVTAGERRRGGLGMYSDRNPKSETVVLPTPAAVLCGHGDAVTAVAVCAELDLVVSGSKDGTLILHTLRDWRYMRSASHPGGGAIDRLVVSPNGLVAVYSHDDIMIHVASINAKWLASAEANGRLSSLCVSACGDYLVTGGERGQIVVRMFHSLEAVRHYDGVGVPITSLAVTAEDCFLAGLQDGSLLVYSIEAQQLKRSASHFMLPLAAKS